MNLNYRGIIKFKIGLGVIGLFTVVMLVLVLMQAGATKQDAQTDKLANSMADSLNNYTDSNFAIPASLRAAGIKKTSPYITYTKLSDSKYKFCVTYKTTSSDFDPSAAVSNALMGGVSSYYGGDYTSDNTDLYLPTSHHKGVNCQTVDIGNEGLTGGSGGGSGCVDPIRAGVSTGIMCPLDVDGSGGAGTGDGTPVSADDSQRETDIDALQAHLEAFYATNGYYPTLADLNSSSWRTANMKGLDSSALCDPLVLSQQGCQLVASPLTAAYSYQVTDANKQNCTKDQNCTDYVLTAMLDTGARFTKQSMV